MTKLFVDYDDCRSPLPCAQYELGPGAKRRSAHASGRAPDNSRGRFIHSYRVASNDSIAGSSAAGTRASFGSADSTAVAPATSGGDLVGTMLGGFGLQSAQEMPPTLHTAAVFVLFRDNEMFSDSAASAADIAQARAAQQAAGAATSCGSGWKADAAVVLRQILWWHTIRRCWIV